MTKVLKYSCYDLLRSRWSYAYFGFYLLTSFALIYFSSELSQASSLASLSFLLLSALL